MVLWVLEPIGANPNHNTDLFVVVPANNITDAKSILSDYIPEVYDAGLKEKYTLGDNYEPK